MVAFALTVGSGTARGETNSIPTGLPVTDGLSAFIEADAAELDVSSPRVLSDATPSGMPAILFDGRSDFLRIDGNPDDFDGRAKTTLMVFKPDGLTSGRMLSTGYENLDPEDPDVGPNFRTETMFAASADGGTLSVSHRDIENSFILTRSPTGTLSSGEYSVGVSQWQADGGILVSIRDAANERAVSTNDGADAEPHNHQQTLIGAHGGFTTPGASDFFPGEIAAVLIYDRELDESELISVEEHLHSVYLGDGSGGDLPVTDGLVAHLNASNVQATGDVVERMIDISGRNNDAHRIDAAEGAAVVRVPDLSGQGNHALNRGDILEEREPRLLVGATPTGRNAVSFDGLSSWMDIAGNPDDFDGPDRGRTSLVVFRPKSAGWAERFYSSAYASLDPNDADSGTVERAHDMFVSGGNDGSVVAQNRTTTGGSQTANSWPNESVVKREFHVAVNNWFDNGNFQSIVRNPENERFAGGESGATGVPEGHLYTRIGADSISTDNPLRFSNVDIAAVLIYNRTLSASELNEMEEYLYDLYMGDGLENEDPPVTNDLAAHLSADSVVAEDDRVFEMTDLTGKGNHAESFVGRQTFNATPPSFGVGATPSGKGVLQFSGSEVLEIRGNPEGFDGSEKTSFVIFRPDSFDGHRIINSAYSKLHPEDNPVVPAARTHNMEARSANSGSIRGVNRDRDAGFNSASSPEESIAEGAFFLGVNYLAGTGDMQAVVRNVENERFAGTGSGADAELEGHRFTRIGAGAGTTQDERVGLNFSGDIAAVVIYNRALTEEELLDVEEYLHARYLQEVELLTYDQWRQGFDFPDGLDGPRDDASGDGVSNLEKFAFGLDPLEKSRAGLPSLVSEQIDNERALVFTVPRNPDATGIGQFVQTSTDLLDWSVDSEYIEVIEDTSEILRVRILGADGQELKRFVRVSIELED